MPTQPPILNGMGIQYHQRAVMLCGLKVKADMAHSICGLNTWMADKVWDSSLTSAP